jgi:hypothetical protein
MTNDLVRRFPPEWVRGVVAVSAGVAVTVVVLALALRGNGGVFDFAALSNFLDLRVENNTSRPVTISSLGFRDPLRPGASRDEAAWLNATAGIARVRVSRGGKTIGCLTVRDRKGQQHATALVTTAVPCNA